MGRERERVVAPKEASVERKVFDLLMMMELVELVGVVELVMFGITTLPKRAAVPGGESRAS